MSFVFFPSLPCIINKWHPDFIKVPRPLWQYNVTGGHFNMSRKHLGWYYLRQPVAPKEEEERCHVSSFRCLEGCVMQGPWDCIEQVKVHSKPGSILSFFLLIALFVARVLCSRGNRLICKLPSRPDPRPISSSRGLKKHVPV